MKNEPLFSLTMATYNRAHLLPRAIKSALNQTYRNFELIIIDDASTDNTEYICKSFADDRILYCKQEKNTGVLACRNKAFDLAKGEYIAILDDDDELLPEALETSVKKLVELSSKGINILWFDRLDFERQERSGFGISTEGYVRYEDLLCERIFGDFWMVIKRELMGEKDRFDERLWGNEGYLWLRLHRKSDAFYVPKVLYINYREHGAARLSEAMNRMQNLPRSTLTNRVFLEEHGEELRTRCPKVYGRKLGIVGASQILIGNKNEGRKASLEAFKYHLSIESLTVFLLSYILKGNQILYILRNYMKLKQSLTRRV